MIKRGVRGKEHSAATKKKVFRLWLKCDQNAAETSRAVAQQLGKAIPPSTITRWRDRYNWEQNSRLVDNEVARLLRESDDPVLQALAMDDVEMARVIGYISRVTKDLWKNMKRHGLLPRTAKELIELTKYAREERERIMSKGKPDAAGQAGNITIYDQRKQMIKMGMEQLSPAERAVLLDQMGSVSGKKLKRLAAAREDAFSDDSDEE